MSAQYSRSAKSFPLEGKVVAKPLDEVEEGLLNIAATSVFVNTLSVTAGDSLKDAHSNACK